MEGDFEVAIAAALLFHLPDMSFDGNHWVPHGQTRSACVAQEAGPSGPSQHSSVKTLYVPAHAALASTARSLSESVPEVVLRQKYP